MTTLAELAARALPADFAWSQSAIVNYLQCPRMFRLRWIERRALDHVASGFAGPLGTGVHAGIAAVLQAATAGAAIGPDEIKQLMLAAFGEACSRAQQRGEVLDDEGVEAAIARLEGELFDWVIALANDRRVRGVRWTRVEEGFAWQDRWGRRYQGTIDAAGEAREYVHEFAARGMELAPLEPGTPIVVDWKTGDVAIDHVSRVLNVQLAFYASGLVRQGAPRPRAFLARLSDVAPPKRPKDDQGDGIPRLLKEPNPAYAAAVGIDLATGESARKAFEQCRKAPKDEAGNRLPKWIERENPAYVEATSKPRGPVFYECDINFELATRTINDVIRAAESGFFPASGAATGQCLRCPFRRTCTSNNPETR